MPRRPDPEFLDAVKFALYAEKVGPLLRDHEQVLDTEIDRSMTPDARLRIARAKTQSQKALPLIRRALFLEDDGG